jgi:hypothetical protein
MAEAVKMIPKYILGRDAGSSDRIFVGILIHSRFKLWPFIFLDFIKLLEITNYEAAQHTVIQ